MQYQVACTKFPFNQCHRIDLMHSWSVYFELIVFSKVVQYLHMVSRVIWKLIQLQSKSKVSTNELEGFAEI